MVKLCYYCGKEIDALPYRCKYCNEKFCAKHKIPENHDCPALPKKKIITWIEKHDFQEDYAWVSKWTKTPILILSLACLLYQLISIFFIFSDLTNKYFVALIYFVLEILLYCPVINYKKIRIEYKKRLNELFFDFKGEWKNCLYLGSSAPQDCRVCDNRNRDYHCKECGRRVA